MNRILAEFIGTYALVFFGTGAVIVNELSHGAVSHVGISVVFGLIVMAMIYTFGHVSGAHINPSATLSLALTGRFPGRDILRFMGAQTGGAIAASVTLKFLFPQSMRLGSTIPSGSEGQSLMLEFLMTYLLMLVVLKSTETEATKKFAGLAIGGTVLLEALFGGPISGASMNPVRSLAPALVSGNIHSLWIYLAGPIAGSIGAAETHKRL